MISLHRRYTYVNTECNPNISQLAILRGTDDIRATLTHRYPLATT